jgi:hypothetical protein
VDAGEFGAWRPLAEAISDPWTPLAHAAGDGGHGDEAYLQIVEQVARGLGGALEDDLPRVVIVDVAVDGASAGTCQGTLEWTEAAPGEWRACASPRRCTRGTVLSRAGRRALAAGGDLR